MMRKCELQILRAINDRRPIFSGVQAALFIFFAAATRTGIVATGFFHARFI
jgi:hypothetical protein